MKTLHKNLVSFSIYVLTAFVLLWTGCATYETTINPVKVQEYKPSYLKGFTLITDSEMPAVGRITDYDGRLIGSATLLDSHHILTAGHVVDDSEFHWFETNGMRYCIDSIALPPLFKIGSIYILDAAIAKLYEPCLEEPMQICTKDLVRGESLTVVGHGGKYRKKSDLNTFCYYGTLKEDPFYIKMLCYKGTIWYGDSGGPVLNQNNEIVGIVSSIGFMRGVLYENSATKIERIAPWIILVLKETN